MSNEKNSVGVSKTMFLVGLVIAILVSNAISILVITQTDLAKGPKGDKGDTGPQGEQGLKGDTGPAGEDAREVVFAYWDVTWKALTGDLQWTGDLGTSTLSSTFDYDFGPQTLFLDYGNYIGFEATMHIKTERPGPFRFTIGSDDGSWLYIDGTLRIDNWGTHTYRTKSTLVWLDPGYHTLTLWFYEVTHNARVSFDCDPDILTWYD